ncbi:MAG: hypothetical protein SNJ49_14810 [Chloracidobacterium sp.]
MSKLNGFPIRQLKPVRITPMIYFSQLMFNSTDRLVSRLLKSPYHTHATIMRALVLRFIDLQATLDTGASNLDNEVLKQAKEEIRSQSGLPDA